MTGQVIVIFYSHILEKTLSVCSIIFTCRWRLFGKHSSNLCQWCQYRAYCRHTNAQNICSQFGALGMKSGCKGFAYFPISFRAQNCKARGRKYRLRTLSALRWSSDMFTNVFVSILGVVPKIEGWSNCEIC